MTFPKYPEYKDSGVEWLGEVPAHWAVKPLKRAIASVESGTSVNAADMPAAQGELGVLKTSCVYKGWFDWRENKTVNREDLGRISCPVRESSLIVSRMNTPDLVGSAGLVVEAPAGIFLPDRLWQVSMRKGCNPKYYYYFTRTPAYRDQVRIACAGTSSSMQNLGQDEFGAIWHPSPLMEEQQAIAAFLDHETARIDALVEEQQRLIELLKGKRQAVISHAVTKGLDPDALMKESGVEWLGEVPAHWEIMKFLRCVKIAEGQVDPKLEEYREKILIAPNHVESATGRILSMETAESQGAESGKYVCEAGDVVYSKIRPALRKACIIDRGVLCSADMYPLRPLDNLSGDFLLWSILSEPFSRLTILESERVAMPKVNRESLNEFYMAVPPLEEQARINDHISQEIQRVDQLASIAAETIELLSERRSALISAAVTGKIDVRGWQAPSGSKASTEVTQTEMV